MPDTHVVTNQVPPLVDHNPASSPVLIEALIREGGQWGLDEITELGALSGSAQAQRWGDLADRNQPILHTHDRYGHRVDEIEYDPAYHELMRAAIGYGLHAAPWADDRRGAHVVRAAKMSVWTPEPGHVCPISMTYAVVPALRHNAELAKVYEPLLTSRVYDPELKVPATKAGITAGMSMTEKQGGSDVRAGTTQAVPNGDGSYTLTGHKWFTSAAMSDIFLVLAQAPGGLSCFMLPRILPDGSRNRMFLQRLKDKLGNHANASSEVEYDGATAWLVGEEGRGVPTIIEMVHHTRLDCIIAPAAFMRQATANAHWHAAHRTAFQKKLIDQPLMRQVLADLAIESEAATQLAFRIAKSFDDSAKNPGAAAFSRIATPVGKYWLNKRVPNLVYEAMEAHGGAGYVEESVMPRLFRQSPLNSIWEGSGNVICLDVLRAMTREPDAVPAFLDEIERARGENATLDAEIDALRDSLVQMPPESEARRLVERMAIVLQASILVRHAPAFVADAFCATRLSSRPGYAYGALGANIDTARLLERAMPTT